MGTTIYFAYGSNLSQPQMRERCPGGVFLGRAVLPDYRLVFPRSASDWAGGVAGIEPATGAETWGCLYRLTSGDVAELDEYEEYPEAYYREMVTVQTETEALQAMTYIAHIEPGAPFPPSRAYLDTIVGGAEVAGLPGEYLAALRAIETC